MWGSIKSNEVQVVILQPTNTDLEIEDRIRWIVDSI
jgi:hypothetical protein